MKKLWDWLKGPQPDPNPPTVAYTVRALRKGTVWDLDYEGVDQAVAQKTLDWHLAHGTPATMHADGKVTHAIHLDKVSR